MKHAQRLDYARLAEVLHERGLVDPAPLGEILQTSIAGGTPFAEAIIYANLMSDWDLACVVADIFNLPIVTPDVCTPDKAAAEELGISEFLIQHGLVPMGRFGQVLSIAMPCLVPADVLGMLAAQSDMVLQPLVSTVSGNRRWIEDNLSIQEVQTGTMGTLDGSWQNIFDDADAAVQLESTPEDGAADEELDIDRELAELEAEGLEMPTLEMPEDELQSEVDTDIATGPIELPPMPEFNLGEDPAA